MYSVTFKGWLRLRIALAAFLAGSISHPTVHVLGLSSEWYGQVPFLILSGGFVYLIIVGEWERVLYKKRKDPETRPRIVRVGATLFLAGLVISFIFDLPLVEDIVGQSFPHNPLLGTFRLIMPIGAAAIAFGIFENCKRLPARVEQSARKAMGMMKEAGCEIRDDPLWVALDPRLQSAATAYPAEGGSVILVKPQYVDTKWFGGLDNILVHEMAHIYRRETSQPSENLEIIKDFEAKYKTDKSYSRRSYQSKTLIRSMLNLSEVLTDDLARFVLEKAKVAWVEPTRESIQTLVRSKPAWALRTRRKRWKNAMIIAMNSVCIAEMERNKIPDTGDKAKKANQELLSALPEEATRSYDYFHQLALSLKENVSEVEFKTVMESYLAAFIEFAEGRPGGLNKSASIPATLV